MITLENYTKIPNTVFELKRLKVISFLEMGILIKILSLPVNYKMNKTHVAKYFNMSRATLINSLKNLTELNILSNNNEVYNYQDLATKIIIKTAQKSK